MTATDPRQTLPQKLVLFGSARNIRTRALRRAAGFGNRVFRIGPDVVVRPNRRVDVTVEFVVKHLDEIIERVGEGVLRVQHAQDRDADPDELRAIAAVFRGETPAGPIVKIVETEESDDDPIDNPDDDLEAPEHSLVHHPEQDEPETSEPAFEPSFEDEPAPAVLTAPAAPVAVEELPETEDEPQDLAEALPAVLEEPEVSEEPEAPLEVAEEALPAEEAEVERRWLPEGWESGTKKDLLKLCEERGIVVEGGRANNNTLIGLLKDWLKG